MFNLFSLKTNLNQIFLIEDEVDFYKTMVGWGDIIENFKQIILKINERKIKFFIAKKKDYNNPFLLSFFDHNVKNFYPIDCDNLWSNYNFFLNYFKFSDYNYNPKVFQKIHLDLKRYEELGKINRLISFTPFFLGSFLKNKKNHFICKFLPKIKIKDLGFHKNFHFMYMYGVYFDKSKYIKKTINYVSSVLNDASSKKDYITLLNGKIKDCWLNYFNKAHKICQYADYIKLDSDSIIINCGVENGSELKLFNGANKIYNIDPGMDKYLDQSLKYILHETKTKNFFLNYALYTYKGIYTPDEKNKKINVTTLKDIIKNHKINKIDLIKSDIEGAERFMINDLIEICKKYNSQLAISIYHTNHFKGENEKLYDLVNIPLKLIERLKNRYNFYFKHYCYERWEGIFYCIPKNS